MVTQLRIETIVAPVGKSASGFDLWTEVIFGGNGRAKIYKFLDCIKSIVIGRTLVHCRCRQRTQATEHFSEKYCHCDVLPPFAERSPYEVEVVA